MVPAGIGVEIYDVNNIVAFDDPLLTVSDLNIIFSTSGYTQAPVVVNDNGNYQSFGYSCPTGYVYSECDNVCVRYETCYSGYCECLEVEISEIDILSASGNTNIFYSGYNGAVGVNIDVCGGNPDYKLFYYNPGIYTLCATAVNTTGGYDLFYYQDTTTGVPNISGATNSSITSGGTECDGSTDCSGLAVSFSLSAYTSTTPSITPTPTVTLTKTVGVVDTVEFEMLNNSVVCEYVKVLVSCEDGTEYYVTDDLLWYDVPVVSGTTFLAVIDGEYICVTYTSDNNLISSNSNVDFIDSIYGECGSCFNLPSNTPTTTITPTPTLTPTQTTTPTLTPTNTPTPTVTKSPGASQTPTPRVTATPTKTQTPTPSVTKTPTPTPNYVYVYRSCSIVSGGKYTEIIQTTQVPFATTVGNSFRDVIGNCWSYMGRFTSPYIPNLAVVIPVTFTGNYFASAPAISYSSCSACVPVVENIKINWFFEANNGAYNSNITNPNLTMTATTSSGSIVKLNTNNPVIKYEPVPTEPLIR